MKKKLLFCVFGLAITAGYSQDNCGSALAITAGTYVVDGINGTGITSGCSPNTGSTSAAEWYSYTPTEDYTVTITTDLQVNFGGDTRFQVYKGTCNALVCVAGDDDGGILGDPSYLSVVTFNVTQGVTYTIAFDNHWNSNAFTFQLSEGEFVPPPVLPITFTAQPITLNNTYQNCVVDMNGDYLDDIVGVSNGLITVLHQNTNGTFTTTNTPTLSTSFLPSWSIAAGDIDNNGRNDLLYGGGSGVSFMKQSATGDSYVYMGGFEYVFSQRSNFVDLNKDGHLDAFVCHDIAPNVYYLNDGTGILNFYQGGVGDFPTGGNYGSIWVDYDNDGDSDLFIAKCRGGNSGANIDELHRNNGDGTFTNVSVEAGMAEASQSWSSAWADYNNDGYMDAFIGASSFATGGHKVRKNNGDGTFTDVTPGSGFETFQGQDVENVAHDFDNDGYEDILTANHTIMFNNKNFTFTAFQIPASSGPVGDLNNDGFLDIQNGSTVFLNAGNENNWITINLQGVQSNRNGIGARVELYGAWGKQIRDVRSGDGFEYMSTLNVHFGIGTAETITKLVIKWPSGITDEILNPTINQHLLVVETSTLGVNNPVDSEFSLYPNPATDKISFNFKSTDAAITKADVYDIAGKKVLSSELTANSLNVHSLNSGTYIVILRDADGKSLSSKFIKK